MYQHLLETDMGYDGIIIHTSKRGFTAAGFICSSGQVKKKQKANDRVNTLSEFRMPILSRNSTLHGSTLSHLIEWLKDRNEYIER